MQQNHFSKIREISNPRIFTKLFHINFNGTVDDEILNALVEAVSRGTVS